MDNKQKEINKNVVTTETGEKIYNKWKADKEGISEKELL